MVKPASACTFLLIKYSAALVANLPNLSWRERLVEADLGGGRVAIVGERGWLIERSLDPIRLTHLGTFFWLTKW